MLLYPPTRKHPRFRLASLQNLTPTRKGNNVAAFSPAVKRIHTYSASPSCAKPEQLDAQIVVGHRRAVEILLCLMVMLLIWRYHSKGAPTVPPMFLTSQQPNTFSQ
jgi:hypothetical protein